MESIPLSDCQRSEVYRNPLSKLIIGMGVPGKAILIFE